MSKTIAITLYQYNELPTEKAKARARQWWDELNDDWYRNVYEDAEQAGVTIKSFDVYQGNIEIELKTSDTETAEYILQNHGEVCDTYKASKAWEAGIDALPELPEENAENYNEVERQLCEGRDVVDSQFMAALRKAYLKMLKEELEYQQSEECIAEVMEANEYTFTEDGKRYEAPQGSDAVVLNGEALASLKVCLEYLTDSEASDHANYEQGDPELNDHVYTHVLKVEKALQQ